MSTDQDKTLGHWSRLFDNLGCQVWGHGHMARFKRFGRCGMIANRGNCPNVFV